MIVVNRLIWETSNIDHIARHGISQQEVEEVCHGQYVVKDAHGGRVMIIGPTLSGRALCIILDPEPDEGVWHPVTARSADRGERKKFTLETGVKL